jgi:hypothetical protein
MQARGHRVVVHGAHGSRIVAEARALAFRPSPGHRQQTPGGVMAMRRALHAAPFDIVNTHSSTDTWLTAVALRLGGRARPALVRTRHVRPGTQRRRYALAVSQGDRTAGHDGRRRSRATLIRDNGIDPGRIDSIPTGTDEAHFAPGDRLRTPRAGCPGPASDRDRRHAARLEGPPLPARCLRATPRPGGPPRHRG